MTAPHLDPEIVERAARDLDPYAWELGDEDMRNDARNVARSMFTAALGDHSVIVPREPTPAHIEAAHKAKIFLNMTDDGWAKAYAAMISAAHDKGDG